VKIKPFCAILVENTGCFRENVMKKILLLTVCLAFITAVPLSGAELEKKPVTRTGQVLIIDENVDAEGVTQTPNKPSTTEKVSSTGHKHDGQGSEDLRPNPLNRDAAQSVNPDRVQPGNPPVQK